MPIRPVHVIAFAIGAMSCGNDVQFGCTPTPSCSLHPERFEPPPVADGGLRGCDAEKHTCAALHVAAGREHNCAITPLGELLCWGRNQNGQLGIGAITGGDAGVAHPNDPLDAGANSDAGLALSLTDAVDVSVGDAHSCALDAAGAVHCWGRNREGQVNGVASEDVATAVVVDGITATGVAAGGAHTCVVSDDGVWCWGDGSHGQAGRDPRDAAMPPGLVAGTAGAVEVAAGTRHSCARFEGGTVACWGELYDEESGGMRAFATPVAIDGLADTESISAGAGFTCALHAGGKVACFGLNNSGQLGDGTTVSSATPVEVVGLEISLQVSAGGAELDGELTGHACALTKTFFARCWGRNLEGQVGSGVVDNILTASAVRGERGEEDDEPYLPDITELSAGGFHTCSIDHDGPILCWGADNFSQLGVPPPAPFGHPVETKLFR